MWYFPKKQCYYTILCYRAAVNSKMVLSLSRSLASNQIRRTFTHQTWVSGHHSYSLAGFAWQNIVTLNSVHQNFNSIFPGPPRTRIPFAEKCAHGLLISAGVLAGDSHTSWFFICLLFLSWLVCRWFFHYHDSWFRIITLILFSRTHVDSGPSQRLQAQRLNIDVKAWIVHFSYFWK